MDVASPPPTEAVSAGPESSFQMRWDGWAVFAIFVAVLVLFFLAQIVISVVVLGVEYGSTIMTYVHDNDIAGLNRLLTTPEGLAKVFSAPALFIIQLGSSVTLVWLTLRCARVLGATPRDLGVRPTTSRAQLIGILGGFALLGLSLILELGQDKIFGPHPQTIVKIFEHHHGALAFALDICSVAVFAPIAEEIFFRGLLFTALVQRIPLPLAALVSGAIFGASHFEWWSIVPLTALGVGLAYIYYTTRTIWASVAAHATINAISLTLAFVNPNLGS